MNFASALFALKRGHKIKRRHWTGFWVLTEDKKNVEMHCFDGSIVKITDTDDVLYTLENCACDDWEIADDDHACKERT